VKSRKWVWRFCAALNAFAAGLIVYAFFASVDRADYFHLLGLVTGFFWMTEQAFSNWLRSENLTYEIKPIKRRT
jgi:hypothetical protein